MRDEPPERGVSKTAFPIADESVTFDVKYSGSRRIKCSVPFHLAEA